MGARRIAHGAMGQMVMTMAMGWFGGDTAVVICPICPDPPTPRTAPLNLLTYLLDGVILLPS